MINDERLINDDMSVSDRRGCMEKRNNCDTAWSVDMSVLTTCNDIMFTR